MAASIFKHRVVIIGAGAAGLKAAARLAELGIDAVVLEAQTRVGGRVHTDHSVTDVPLDMGACWFHDTLSNPLFDAAVEQKLPIYYDDGEIRTYTRHGEVLASSKIPAVAEEAEKFVEMSFFSALDVPEVSLKHKLQEYIDKRRPLLTEEQQKYAPQLVRTLELWHGSGWESVAARHSVLSHQGRNCFNSAGYDVLINHLASQARKIELGCPVTGVRSGGAEESSEVGFTVETASGNRYLCEYVIVAVPLSVLRGSVDEDGVCGSIRFESGLLPRDLCTAVKQMSFATLGKVYMKFPAVVWPSSDRFVVLAEPGVPEKPVRAFSQPVLFINMANVNGDASLVAVTAGEMTLELESHPEKAWEVLKPAVETFCPGIGDPVVVKASSWSVNPYFRGSYSVSLVDDEPFMALEAMGKGVGKLRFAGEHTVWEGNGCVNGAWESGLREADWIAKDIRESEAESGTLGFGLRRSVRRG